MHYEKRFVPITVYECVRHATLVKTKKKHYTEKETHSHPLAPISFVSTHKQNVASLRDSHGLRGAASPSRSAASFSGTLVSLPWRHTRGLDSCHLDVRSDLRESLRGSAPEYSANHSEAGDTTWLLLTLIEKKYYARTRKSCSAKQHSEGAIYRVNKRQLGQPILYCTF